MFVGSGVHRNQVAVAYVASDPGGSVVSVGPIGTPQCSIDRLIRRPYSGASMLMFVSRAWPGGVTETEKTVASFRHVITITGIASR
jgi:hypothetical protein